MSFVGQEAAFEIEPENVHDCFAVAIKHLLLLLCSFFTCVVLLLIFSAETFFCFSVHDYDEVNQQSCSTYRALAG